MARFSGDRGFFVLDRRSREVLYEAATLPQALGFTHGCPSTTLIATVCESFKSDWEYRVCLMDEETGEVLARGPQVNLSTAPEAIERMRVVVLPISLADMLDEGAA